MRVATNKPKRLKLLTLLLDAHALLMTDPSDRIYGFLGLAADAHNLVQKPDYSLSTADVYKAFTKAIITTSRDLRVICRFQTYITSKFQLSHH